MNKILFQTFCFIVLIGLFFVNPIAGLATPPSPTQETTLGWVTENYQCLFSDDTQRHECYTTNHTTNKKFGCSGYGKCSGQIYGSANQKFHWQSSCGNRHETYMDGHDDTLPFTCTTHAEPQATITTPHTFNLDFGPWRPMESPKTGPAADGQNGDYWNTVAVAWNDNHIQSGLKSASGEISPIHVNMINLGGAWSNSGRLGINDPMMDTFNYPYNNKGGTSRVILHNIPPGKYKLYIYGHGTAPTHNGNYTVKINDQSHGEKSTTATESAVISFSWAENIQYVKFSGLKIQQGDILDILIEPGGHVTDHHGRTFADSIICGLQLIPEGPEISP